MRIIICFLLLFPFSTFGFTGDSTRYLTSEDTLNLSISSFNEKIIDHYFEKGQTLFSLAKFYGLTVEELKYYNPGLLDGVKIGDKVSIPIPNRSIIRYPPPGFLFHEHIPLFYKIQKGDTFYGLSKRVLKMPIDEIQRRLYPRDLNLKIGQILFVGWISIDGIPESYRTVRGHPLFRKNQELQPQFLRNTDGKKVQEVQGAAAWQEGETQNTTFLALFDKVKPGAYIEIYYPLRGRRVFAKVVGPIPPTLYENNVQVVVSPLTAKLLGARDEEFFVKVFYY